MRLCVKKILMSKPSVLIVDDEPGVRSALSGVLRDEGYDVAAVESGERCLDRVVRDAFDVTCSTCGCRAWMVSRRSPACAR